MGDIAHNHCIVRERIARAAEKSGREAQAIQIIAVTKTMPVERIREAIESGLTEFGENRVQEAEIKFARVDPKASESIIGGKLVRNNIILHLIGSLQRNKARLATDLFDCIQSVDRLELVHALDESYSERPGRPKLHVFIQVNLTGEESKSGVSSANLPTLADSVMASNNLQCVGLMTIARFGAANQELRHTFATLRSLLEKLRQTHSANWIELSMGMSDDYEIAVEEGATTIRLGRALFGIRNTSTTEAIC